MSRNLLFSTVAVLLILSAATAASPMARIDLTSSDRKTPLQRLVISEKGRMNPFSWEADGGNWGLVVNLPASGSWQEGFVTVKPESDVTLIISLMGPDVRSGKDAPRQKIEMEYSSCSINGNQLITGGKNIVAWHDKRHDLYAKLSKGVEYTLKFSYRRYQEPVTIQAGAEFRPVDMSDLEIRPGSALDFSSLVKNTPITETGRLTIRDGRFVPAAMPERRIRFTGCSINFRSEFLPLDKAGIKRYVALAQRQGYNMFRAHYLDAYLMWGAKKDLEFVPEYLDRFHYLVACMKEAGMYLSLDAMSAPSGYRAIKNDWSPYAGPQMSRALLLDPAIREEWKKGTAQLLHAINPYTGTRLLDDPVLVNVVPYNEQDHFFVFRDREPFLPRWRDFLVKKYGAPKDIPLDPANADSREFIISLYKEMNNFYTEAMREIGFHGYLSQLDCDSLMRYTILRNDFPVISMHAYHAHPSNYIASGSQIEQSSSVQTRAAYLTGIGGVRFLDRPFMITEINQVFWNRYRYEQGLLLGAYSAYQDYDCFIPHSGPVLFRGGNRINPFGVGADPVCRASDAITNFLIHGDVLKPAPRSVEFVLESAGMIEDGQSESYPPDIVRESLLFTRSGIRFGDLPRPAGISPAASDLSIQLEHGRMSQPEYKQQIFQQLLAGGNPSRPAEGFFVTDSGEITLDSRRGYFQVNTPKLQGASSVEPLDFQLPELTVKASIPGSATAIALDGRPVAESSRILLVLVGDALNDGMTFSDNTRTTLLALGSKPLLQTCRATVTLRNGGGNAQVWPLRMNGERRNPIPVRTENGRHTFEIDTATLPGGPAVFFEIKIN